MRRLRLILGTELSEKNKIQAIGSLAVPVLRYSFEIVNWYQKEPQKLDRKMRKLLTCNVISHVKCIVLLHYNFPKYVCAVPNMALFCSSLILCFCSMFLRQFLNDVEMVPVAPYYY